MAGTCTVDASVFLNAFNPYEAGHEESRRFLVDVQERGAPIVVPTLVLPEVAAAVHRGRQDEGLAREFAAAVHRLPHVVWVPIDLLLAQQATDVAAQHRLRGSDAVCAAVALRLSATLTTLDREQGDHLREALTVRTSEEALAGTAAAWARTRRHPRPVQPGRLMRLEPGLRGRAGKGSHRSARALLAPILQRRP